MTPHKYERAAELFGRISELPEDERAAALDAGCEGSGEIRAQVMVMLEADRVAGGDFLERPAIEDAAELLARKGASRPAAGTVIGNYQIVRQIGAGGMGVVYEATDRNLHRRAAVKILPHPAAGEGAERIKRFQQEARAASLLNHPNIVSIYDAGFDQGYYYIAMELVEGRTLRQVMADERRTLDDKKILDWIAQVASALGAAHEAGIVHRDIKPENIMVRPDGFVKVLDFGLAKLREAASGSRPPSSGFLTRPGHVAGTIQYLSPEQVAGRPVDGRSDIFSLGVVAYELVTGVRPFEGPTDGALFNAILQQAPARPSSIRPAIDAEMDKLVLSALEKDPELRFQTAGDLRSHCKRLSRDSSPSGSPAAPIPPAARRRSPFAVWAGASIACLVAGTAIWFAISRSRSSSHKAPTPFQFERLTDAPGEESSPSISADGKQFVYASAFEGKSHIYLQRTGGRTLVNLTRDSTGDDTQPALSPDGSRIVFRSERSGGGLFVMESTGENPRRISREGYLPAWSPDDRYVVYSDQNFDRPTARDAPVSRLFVVDVSDGSERKLNNTDDAIQPNWSPHGYRIAYWGVSKGGRRDIFTVAASGQARPAAVTEDAAVDWRPVWSPSGEYLYFISDRGGSMNIWRVAINEASGRPLAPSEPVTVPAAYVSSLSFSANGKTLVYSQASQRTTLASAAFDSARRVLAGKPEPVAGGTYTVADFSFSPDGSKLVFDTLGEAPENLWIMKADGSGRTRLTSGQSRDRAPQWSPKGDEILFFSDRSGQYDEWLIHPDGSGLRALTAVDHPGMQKAIWSGDGDRILACRGTETPAILDPSATQPVRSPAAAPGIRDLITVLFNAWTGADGGLAIGDTYAGPGAPEIVLYSSSTGKLEFPGVKGRSGYWLAGGKDPGHRFFLFARGGDCLLYDRTLKRETHLFSIGPNRIQSLGMDPAGRRIYFTQVIRDADLWLARLEK